MGAHDFWNDDRIATLKQMWMARRPVREIAANIGCTRNAVIGKAGRLSLPLYDGMHRRAYIRKPSDAAPKRKKMPLAEQIEWAKSLNEKMEELGITQARLAIIAGAAEGFLSRVRNSPETTPCSERFRRRIDDALAEILRRKGLLP